MKTMNRRETKAEKGILNFISLCASTHSSAGWFTKTFNVSCYPTWHLSCKGGGLCVDISPYFIIPLKSCAIHLCQPLYQPAPGCVCTLNWLMNSSLGWWALQGPTSIRRHQVDLKHNQILPLLGRRLRQHFSMTLQLLWWIFCCEETFLTVE